MWLWDAPQGYHQIGVEEESQVKLVFLASASRPLADADHRPRHRKIRRIYAILFPFYSQF